MLDVFFLTSSGKEIPLGGLIAHVLNPKCEVLTSHHSSLLPKIGEKKHVNGAAHTWLLY